MSTCNFSIPFSGEAEIILAKAKAAIESQQGIFTGDTNSGNFEVTVFGKYSKRHVCSQHTGSQHHYNPQTLFDTLQYN